MESRQERGLEVAKDTDRKDTREPAVFQVLRRECPHSLPSTVQAADQSASEAAGLVSKTL